MKHGIGRKRKEKRGKERLGRTAKATPNETTQRRFMPKPMPAQLFVGMAPEANLADYPTDFPPALPGTVAISLPFNCGRRKSYSQPENCPDGYQPANRIG